MISIFECGLRLHKKTYPPILVRWFLFHFPQITYAKTNFFSWQRPFQTKLLFFQTIESAKRVFVARAGSGKPALVHALFLEKNYGAMFSREVQGHMQKFNSFKGKKKKRPKKSLTLFMHAHLQFKDKLLHHSGLNFKPSRYYK